MDDGMPMKWKPIIGTFPNEAKENRSVVATNPIIDSLNARMLSSRTQPKLSAEVIQKEEIYNQAEMEANKRMFGCVNPGRCLSKDEIKRRKDIILQIVNERLKSKLSQLMGEFDERVGKCNTYESDRRPRNQSIGYDDYDDDLPEAPPPPTFNTSSDSEPENELDTSMTKEFELYEKEIQEKNFSNPHSVAISSLPVPSFNTIPLGLPRPPQLSNVQQNWPKPTWPRTAADSSVWIPPVGPPQTMDDFPPPLRSEEMAFLQQPPSTPFSRFPTADRSANVWGNTSSPWTAASFPLMPQSTPLRQSIPPPMQMLPRSTWNPNGPRPFTETSVRPTNNSVRPTVMQTTSNNAANLPFVSKSTYVNAIVAAHQPKGAPVVGAANVNRTNRIPFNASQNKFNSVANEARPNELNSRKRATEQSAGTMDNFGKKSNNFHKRVENFAAKKSRFEPAKSDQQQNRRSDYETDRRHEHEPYENPERKSFPRERERNPSVDTNKSSERNSFRAARDRNPSVDTNKSLEECSIEPVEWTNLCSITDKVIALTPNAAKDPTDRLKERNEVLLILAEDPENFYAHVDKYGEQNIKWAVKMAQRVLYPQGRYNKWIAAKLAPFKKAILNGHQQDAPKDSTQRPIETAPPKEWKKLCEIVDRLLDVPTRVMDNLPSSDSRVKERNEILMLLSNDPEDFLLHDEKYGARNVDSSILAAKNILRPNGVPDERIQKMMLRQRELLAKRYGKYGSADRSMSGDRDPQRKRSNHRDDDENYYRSLPKEWTQLCEIVDKVLDTPKEVRVKMSKRDPRWERRDSLLLALLEDPDQLEFHCDKMERSNVDWAIDAAKRVLYPNGSKDRSVLAKLSPQKKLLLRNRQADGANSSKSSTAPSVGSVNGERMSSDKLNDKRMGKHKPHRETLKESQKNKPDERVANNKSTKETVKEKEIDESEVWPKLCGIVDKLLDIPANAAEKLDATDKRLVERNDILMVLSNDPEQFTNFEANYGSANVTWVIKAAKKLLYSNGKPNEKFANVLWKQRDAIMRSEEDPKESGGECSEWKCIRKIATKYFLQSCKTATNGKTLTKEQLHQLNELVLQLSDDPGTLRSDAICKKVGDGSTEVVIAKCKHILNRMRTSSTDQQIRNNFEAIRYKMVLYTESLNQSKNIKNYDVILTEVRKVVDQKIFNELHGPNFNKWSKEQKLERNELAILLIKDPQSLRSNEKYLEMMGGPEKAMTVVEEVVAEVEKCLLKCEYVQEAKKVTPAPIIAKIRDEGPIGQFKLKKLTQRIHGLVEQFLVDPKPEVFDIRSNADGTLEVVCANAMTYNWLKESINELDGLWDNAKLSICKAQITRKVLDAGDLKEIKMMLKTVPVETYAVVVKQLKKANAKLNTDRWQLVPSSFNDPKKMFVMVDLESMVELERLKREVIVDSGTIYFDIQYFGEENF